MVQEATTSNIRSELELELFVNKTEYVKNFIRNQLRQRDDAIEYAKIQNKEAEEAEGKVKKVESMGILEAYEFLKSDDGSEIRWTISNCTLNNNTVVLKSDGSTCCYGTAGTA